MLQDHKESGNSASEGMEMVSRGVRPENVWSLARILRKPCKDIIWGGAGVVLASGSLLTGGRLLASVRGTGRGS